ncbi:MAG: helix-turn-helix transcriptional regulator [Oscillospiraceae bacterium]|nr:helix-turn-helix transcriptional regulator [Oscillospiraceae bacterium]
MNYSESIEKTKNYIMEHLSDELTAENIAYQAGYSVFHFCRVFKEETGKSLMSYVREKRLELAETDIEKGEPALDVALKYGFETQSGFARAYERKFGERPTRKMHA